ncbi:MAG: DUF882 domain-containing protein [Ilumatobacter sp.]|nr:DUF882 domain-containing protein [Ilumatobacter sp.]
MIARQQFKVVMSKHFSKHEFTCPCCGRYIVSNHLMAVLELIRAEFMRPVHINSGYRCKKNNEKVGGSKDSKHLLGIAADCHIQGVTPDDIFDFMNMTFPRCYGVGLYNSWVHIDVRPERARWRDIDDKK